MVFGASWETYRKLVVRGPELGHLRLRQLRLARETRATISRRGWHNDCLCRSIPTVEDPRVTALNDHGYRVTREKSIRTELSFQTRSPLVEAFQGRTGGRVIEGSAGVGRARRPGLGAGTQ